MFHGNPTCPAHACSVGVVHGLAADPGELTGREHRLRIGVIVIGALSALFVVSYIAQGIAEGSEYPFVVNSVAKDVLFVALAVIAVGDVRRNTWAVVLLIAAHVALIATLVIEALFGDIHHISHTLAGPGLGAET